MTKFEKISIFVGLSAFLVSAIGGGYTYYLNNVPKTQHLTVVPTEFELRYGDGRFEYTASAVFFNRGEVELILNNFSTHIATPDGSGRKGREAFHRVEWENSTVILKAGESKTVKYETSGKGDEFYDNIFLSKSSELKPSVKFLYRVLSIDGGGANNVVQIKIILDDNIIKMYEYQPPQNETFDGPLPPAAPALIMIK